MTLMATEKPAETRTEYALKSTIIRHGKREVAIQVCPGREGDRAWHEEYAEDTRHFQQRSGLTPDAEVVVRTWTASDWTSA